ncbi:MAG: helicase-related protein, partial [Erysipelotrichaceae bacterium]|nr:helicase-related protein [Erysipelotrichaceae bacterium]
GKTEIAVRAAFKAAAENKQVAVLCPTTILAEQHFRTFSHRFEGFPFTIRVLDRFVVPSKVKETLKELQDGTVDILIGTHRILSRDVVFKDLGLLVVDEEQRFGVEHKERIKELKNNIDVLTLSATPIPRTLQMSLIGIRQLSQLETPPGNRYNVQTYVVEKNKGLVIDAIEKELARNGQVFYLYNSIAEIYNVARSLQMSIPDARIGIIHGKMDRESIEDVMMQFIHHELNVLVCTTIIENGIDIPNANTILIDNAHNFGLAQIYQIKGRVGRSDRVAYAYLLVPPRRQLSEVAGKRLQAVKEFAKLGSGYRIAMRDLTIRGAGDLLGPEQSGFIDTVGIDMYIEMLNSAIERKKGIVKEPEQQIVHTNVSRSSYIPKKFAPDDYDKLGMYQNIDSIYHLNDLDDLKDQVIDQYGRLPEEVKTLFEKRKLDILVSSPDVSTYREIRGNAEITFSVPFSQKIDGVKLFEIFSDLSKDISLSYKNQSIIATVPIGKDTLEMCSLMITKAKEALRNADR